MENIKNEKMDELYDLLKATFDTKDSVRIVAESTKYGYNNRYRSEALKIIIYVEETYKSNVPIVDRFKKFEEEIKKFNKDLNIGLSTYSNLVFYSVTVEFKLDDRYNFDTYIKGLKRNLKNIHNSTFKIKDKIVREKVVEFTL